MKKLWICACALLLTIVTACSDYEIFAEDLNPVDGAVDDPVEEPDNWDGTFNTSAIQAPTVTNRAVVASFNGGVYHTSVSTKPPQGVLVSWRWLSSDPADIAFDVYRNGTKLNTTPITNSTNYKDLTAEVGNTYTYEVRNSMDGTSLGNYTISTRSDAAGFYRSIKLKSMPGYDANDGAVGDLDGDGEYEIVVKRQVIGAPRDVGDTEVWTGLQPGSCILEAYKLDGSSNGVPMWTINMGININQGAHTTQFLVYDFDGDGKAEVALRTAEGTTFGDGTMIGDVNGDGRTDYRSTSSGRVLDGPEFLSLVNGETGAEIARTEYIPRGEESTWNSYWGDGFGNRSERFLMGVGHFDSQDGRASIIICRGYYVNYQVWAVHYNDDGKLRNRWKFNTASGYSADWLGQGNHNLSVGDVDNDGKDEIIYGACAIDHDGTGLYTTGLGHGDALHLGKFDPNRNGLQVVDCHEEQDKHGGKAIEYRDAATGQVISYINGSGDVGRCMVADIDPDNPGCEFWGSTGGMIYSCSTGANLGKTPPTTIGHSASNPAYSYNMGIWWSGSLNRQMLDGHVNRGAENGKGEPLVISYTDGRLFMGSTFSVSSNNDSKANPCFYGDIWGDWREEMIFPSSDYTELRIFTTDFETNYRIRPLMEDHIYRISAAHQNIGYNQPTHTGFYLGSDKTDYR